MMNRRTIFPVWPSLFLLGLVSTFPLAAQTASEPMNPQMIDPRGFGFDLPPGELKSTTGARVVTQDGAGHAVVAKVHVLIGKNPIVLLPDGRLVARKEHEVTPSERPFEPIGKEQLAARLTEKEFAGFKKKLSKNYVFLYSCSEEFAFGTSRILESMLPGVQKFAEGWKIETHEPEVPLVVVMFRTEDEFQNYRRMPDGVIAYYHTLTNQVLLFEQSRQFQARPDIAMQQAISTIAHEGTHQILHNIGVQQRLSVWPMWLSEGLAEFFAPTSFTKRLTWKGAGQVNDLRMFELEQYLKSKGAAEPNGATIQQTVLANRLRSTGYATAWSLTHYLAAKKRVEFNRYVADIAKLGPFSGAVNVEPPGVVKGNLAKFEEYFGGDTVDLETKLVQHLKKLPYNDPFAGMPHFVAMFSYLEGKRERRELGTFHNPSQAHNWVQDMREKNVSATNAAGQIREFPNRATAETFARGWQKGG